MLKNEPEMISKTDDLGSLPWCSWGSAAVSDGLRNIKKSFQSLEGGIRPLSDSFSVCGPAFTVRCYPGATWALEQSLELAAPGDVLVVDAGARADVIIMGALMSQRAKSRGIAGAIVDGAVRDVAEIVQLGFPVFSRHICPRAGTYAEIGEWQTTICCGRVPVEPGDWIVGDSSGIVVVPIHLARDAAAQAKAIRDREQKIAQLMRDGHSLAEAARLSK
jgi:regulator of RNase E activity RraA